MTMKANSEVKYFMNLTFHEKTGNWMLEVVQNKKATSPDGEVDISEMPIGWILVDEDLVLMFQNIIEEHTWEKIENLKESGYISIIKSK